MNKIKSRIFLTMVLVGAFVGTLVLSGSAYADSDTIYKKALLNGLLTCYSDTYMEAEVDNATNLARLMTNDGGRRDGLFDVVKGDGSGDTVRLPNQGVGNSLKNDARMSCYGVFDGTTYDGGKADGLYDVYGKSYTSPEDLGYKAEMSDPENPGSEGDYCRAFTVRRPTGTGSSNKYMADNYICFPKTDSNGSIDIGKAYTIDADGGKNDDVSVRLLPLAAGYFSVEIKDKSDKNDYREGQRELYCSAHSTIAEIDNCFDNYATEGNGAIQMTHVVDGVEIATRTDFQLDSVEEGDPVSQNGSLSVSKWVKGGGYSGGAATGRFGLSSQELYAAQSALGYFTGGDSNFESYRFTDDERYELLKTYVEKAMQKHRDFTFDTDFCYASKAELNGEYGMLRDGQWCKLVGYKNISDRYNIVDTSNYRTLRNASLEEVLQELLGIDDSVIEEVDGGDGINSEELENKLSGNLDMNKLLEQCNDTDIEGIKWFACPALANSTYTAEGIDGVVQDWVDGWTEINKNLYGLDSPAHAVWSIMRDVANVIIVIILLVVIFSQLTGVGIDNYGIKKMLPKIIVMAILINLSFIICALILDVSNILGVGLKSMLASVGQALLDSNSAAADTANFLSSMVSGLIWAVTGVAAASTTVITIASLATSFTGSGVMVIFLLIIMLLGILAAILIFFIMLGVRMLLVIACLILAPVALVMYILPNTKGLYKKWFDTFKAAVVIFPVCGMFFGISYLLKAIVITSGELNFGLAVVASMAPYLVFFFLPSMLKAAIGAVGLIGGAITAAAGTMRGAVGKAQGTMQSSVQNSEQYKNAMQRRSDMRSANWAQRVRRRLGDKVASGQATAGELYVFGKANAMGVAAQKRNKESELWADQDYYKNMQTHVDVAMANEREKTHSEIFARQDKKQNQANLVNALKGNDAEKAAAAMKVLNQQGGLDEMLTEFSNLSDADWANMKTNGVYDRVLDTMGGMDADALRAFAKYRKSGGGANLSDWVAGNTAAVDAGKTGLKEGTYAQHIKDGGRTAFNNYTKDEMEFIQKNVAGLTGTGGLTAQELGSRLTSANINLKDARAQTVSENIISEVIENGTIDVGDLDLRPDELAKVRDEYVEKVRDGINKKRAKNKGVVYMYTTEQEMQNAWKSQIDAAKADQTIGNRISDSKNKILDIR